MKQLSLHLILKLFSLPLVSISIAELSSVLLLFTAFSLALHLLSAFVQL